MDPEQRPAQDQASAPLPGQVDLFDLIPPEATAR